MEAAGLLLAGPKANLKAKLTEKEGAHTPGSEDAPANAGRRERSEQGAKAPRRRASLCGWPREDVHAEYSTN